MIYISCDGRALGQPWGIPPLCNPGGIEVIGGTPLIARGRNKNGRSQSDTVPWESLAEVRG